MMTDIDPTGQDYYYEFNVAYRALCFDHPELFWLYAGQEAEMVYLSEAGNYGGFYFVYIKMAEPFTNYETQMNAFNAAAASFLADINQDASDYEIVRQIHDKLIDLVNYNDPVGDGEVEWDRGQDLAHTAYGCLVADSSGNPNYAVCDGYTLAMEYLLQQCGIEAAFIGGMAGSSQADAGGHAWNIVKIGGAYYHLEATFDNTLSHMGPVRYDYFNLDDGKVFRDHEPVIWKVPACTASDGFYYRVKKLSFTKIEEVEKRALQAAKKGKELIFHWRGGALNRETAAQMLKAFKEAGEKKGKYPRAAINWPQAVLLVEYLSELPAEELVTEKANEGEQQM